MYALLIFDVRRSCDVETGHTEDPSFLCSSSRGSFDEKHTVEAAYIYANVKSSRMNETYLSYGLICNCLWTLFAVTKSRQ
jgi:hypothetical protein